MKKGKIKILVVAPHPDDEVLGCGGAIAKHSKKGNDVYLCIVTESYKPEWSEEFLKNRPKEIKKAAKILGIKKTYLLGFPTVKLDTIPQKTLNDSIQKVFNKVKPQVLYLPYGGDLMKDHRLVFEASLVAARPVFRSSLKQIMAYETLSETEWGFGNFKPNIYEDISATFKTKIAAMKVYGGELRKFPHPRSLKAIEALALKRGSEALLPMAEAFMLIREINT